MKWTRQDYLISTDKNLLQILQDSEKLLNSAIESNLNMTYESRIEAHENARDLLVDLREAGDNLHARSQSSS